LPDLIWTLWKNSISREVVKTQLRRPTLQLLEASKLAMANKRPAWNLRRGFGLTFISAHLFTESEDTREGPGFLLLLAEQDALHKQRVRTCLKTI
jgi:hypothetical protein